MGRAGSAEDSPAFCAFRSCREATYLIPEMLSENAGSLTEPLQSWPEPCPFVFRPQLRPQTVQPRGRPCLSTDRCLAVCVATFVKIG